MRAALERTLALVTDLIGLRSGWVWLIDPETRQLYSAASYNLPPYLKEPVRMSGTWCVCTDGLASGDVRSKNVDVIECSRLSPAVRSRAAELTAGIRYHASVPLRFRDKPLGVMNVTGPAWRKLTRDELGLLSTIGLQVGAMIERARLAEDESRLARAEERTRLARELHDTLLQSLTAIALQLEGAARDPSVSAAVRGRLDAIVEGARHAAGEARRAVSDLRAAPLAGKPLAAALAGLARSFTSETGVIAEVDAADEPLPSRTEAELYRIVQEALANVGKHARAASVSIVLSKNKSAYVLSVADDGVGMSHVPPTSASHGIAGMEERAALIGGRFSIARRRGAGTKVSVTFPADAKRR